MVKSTVFDSPCSSVAVIEMLVSPAFEIDGMPTTVVSRELNHNQFGNLSSPISVRLITRGPSSLKRPMRSR